MITDAMIEQASVGRVLKLDSPTIEEAIEQIQIATEAIVSK